MTREAALLIMVALLALALLLMWRGWRRRSGRYSYLPELMDAREIQERPSAQFGVYYVATTEAEQPLERVVRRPLGYRAKIQLGVSKAGLWLDIPGEGSFHIPRALTSGVGQATWTIDRVVDADQLVFVRWKWGDLSVDSYFRSVDYSTQEIIEALSLATDSKEDDQ